MKQINILYIALIAIIFIPIASSAELPTIIVSEYQVSPEMFMPGDSGMITITLTNTARAATKTETRTVTENRIIITKTDTDTKTIDLNAIIEYIRLSGNGLEVIEDKYRRVGSIGPGQSKTISFEVKAPRSQGTFFPVVWIDMKNAENVRFPIPINVVDGSVDMAIKTPPIILMEETATLNIDVSNKRPNLINSVHIIPKSNNNIEISPSKIFIGSLKPDEIRNISFDVFSRTQGTKNIDFELIFRNGIHNIHTETTTIQFEVSNHPSARLIAVEYPKTVIRGNIAEIEFEVINDRLSSVIGVRVIPIDNTFDISPSEVFIGSMEPDDAFSARFNLHTDNMPLNQSEISFKVEFRDMDGRLFESDAYPISITVTETQAEPVSPMIPIIIIVLIVLALIVGFFVYKRKQRKS